MANEDQKDFNAMLNNSKDMPKIQVITDQKSIEKYGGDHMYFAPPIDYDTVMKRIPEGKVTTINQIRDYFADRNHADFTEPITAGIFVSIAAWASEQRTDHHTPYWRTLKANGELNPKYPGGIEAQKAKLEAEGHTIIQKGRTNIRYYVKNYENVLFQLSQLQGDSEQKNQIEIRVIEKKDREPALKLIWEVFQQYEAPDYPPEGLTTFYHSVIVNEEYLSNLKMYGAYDQNVLTGVIATRSKGSHVALFFVDGKHHRQGIGRKLFQAALKDCPTDQITVNASPYATEVYHHLGFTDTQPEQMTDGMRYTPMVYCMEKNE